MHGQIGDGALRHLGMKVIEIMYLTRVKYIISSLVVPQGPAMRRGWQGHSMTSE